MFSNSIQRTGLFFHKESSGIKCLTQYFLNSRSTATLVGDKPKTMDDLNGPSFLTSLYWLFGKGYFPITHQMQIEHSKIYGPLWKSKYGPLVIVNVANADLIEQVLRQEGRYPIRTDMPHWRGYRQLRNHANGPLTGIGPEWQRIRSILNPRMLKPKHVSGYANAINGVARDFIEKVAKLRTVKGDVVLVQDVAGELYKFAFEGICSVVFETRMGCLNDVIPEETQKFITSVGEMFPDELVRNKMTEIEGRVERGQEVEGEYLTHLLIGEQMSLTELLGSVTEILLAGVDTTSNTISWALYHLAREPEIQQKLLEEINNVCPGDQVPCSDDISRMPLLKAVIRETLRLYPVVPGNARVIAEKEIVVGGHLFPKNTLFHLCHYAVSYDEKIFPDPFTFLPQRWIREKQKQIAQHPFGSVPFGFGIRACLGRRVAELEMYLLLSQLIKRFEVRPDPSGKTVKAITRTLMIPGNSIDLQFIDR
ncbi:hypothetical protein DNTS_016372 [Danionella cerebrum]|uniref:Cytochrome P450 n=1 Tax=Danionella cerebrum TaxID=2873325 RepID=A0A553N1I4_9TELE|nr:hypothetical protein DNTS_016372 [Danionella translucida]